MHIFKTVNMITYIADKGYSFNIGQIHLLPDRTPPFIIKLCLKGLKI